MRSGKTIERDGRTAEFCRLKLLSVEFVQRLTTKKSINGSCFGYLRGIKTKILSCGLVIAIFSLN